MTTVTKYEILRATFVGYGMPSGMQRVCQDLNLPDYGRQLIDGVYVPVWYNSLQLPTQEKNKNSSRNELRKSNWQLF